MPTNNSLADHAYDSVWLCALEQAQEAGLALRAEQSPRWNHGRHDLEVILPGMDRYPYEISSPRSLIHQPNHYG